MGRPRLIPLSAFGLLTTAQVAARFGCTPQTARNWVLSGRLPAVALGGRAQTIYLVREADLTGFRLARVGRPLGGRKKGGRA